MQSYEFDNPLIRGETFFLVEDGDQLIWLFLRELQERPILARAFFAYGPDNSQELELVPASLEIVEAAQTQVQRFKQEYQAGGTALIKTVPYINAENLDSRALAMKLEKHLLLKPKIEGCLQKIIARCSVGLHSRRVNTLLANIQDLTSAQAAKTEIDRIIRGGPFRDHPQTVTAIEADFNLLICYCKSMEEVE